MSLFDVWKEESFNFWQLLLSYKCLSLPRVCPAGTLMCSSLHNLKETSLNLCRGGQDGSHCGRDCAVLWLRKPLRFVVPTAFSFSQDLGCAPGQVMCQSHPCPPSHLLSYMITTSFAMILKWLCCTVSGSWSGLKVTWKRRNELCEPVPQEVT